MGYSPIGSHVKNWKRDNLFYNTIEPLLSNHSKCEIYVVAYGRLSLTTSHTTRGLNFES